MRKLKYIGLVGSLFFSVSNFILGNDINLKIEEASQKLKKLESEVVYQKEEEHNTNLWFPLSRGETGAVTFNNLNFDVERIYIVYPREANSVKVINNNSLLRTNVEVIGTRHNPVEHLIYVENNGSMVGSADNVPGISLFAPYVYFKNGEKGKIIGEIQEPILAEYNKELVLENDGLIDSQITNYTARFWSDSLYIRNGKTGKITKPLYHWGENAYIRNDGHFGGIGLFSDKNVGLENVGEITNYLSLGRAKNALLVNQKEGKVDVKYFQLGNSKVQLENYGEIYSTGPGKKLLITSVDAKLINKNKIVGNIEFSDVGKKKTISVDLEQGSLEGNLLLSRDPGVAKVTLDSHNNISGRIEGAGPEDILVLKGKGNISEDTKFNAFEKLYFQDSNWTLSAPDFKIAEATFLENAKVFLMEES